jgi:hypothetical protein
MLKKLKGWIVDYIFLRKYRKVRIITYFSGQIMTGLLNERDKNRLNDVMLNDIYNYSEKMYNIIMEKK